MPPNLQINIELRGVGGEKMYRRVTYCNLILYLKSELGVGRFSNLAHSMDTCGIEFK